MSTPKFTQEEEQEVRAAWASVGSWEQTTEAEEQQCPTCDGEGYVEGVRYDATSVCPATVVGYGIGDGLAAAELLATSTGGLLATLDAERAKSAELHAEVELWREATKGLKWMQQRDRVMRERDELLAALEYCLGELDLPTEERDAARHFTSIDMARAAIARATGGKP